MIASDLQLAGKAWAMERTALEALCSRVIETRELADPGFGELTHSELAVMDGTASIPVVGVILKTKSSWLSFFGIENTSTENTRALLAEALDREDVKQIHLEIDSPGGTVEGVQALAEDIRAAREKKKVTAHAQDLMASAAYWIGSQATTITAGSAAMVGSIGVYTTMIDTSGAMGERGVKVRVVRSHELKGIGAGAGDVTDAQLGEVQRQIDSIAGVFVDAIAAGRGKDTDDIRDLATGQVWVGKEAKRKGLVDRIKSTAPKAQTTEQKQPAPLGAQTTKEHPMDLEKQAAELQERNAELSADATQAKEDTAKANSRADALAARARARLMDQYADRIAPANKSSVDDFAEFCGDDLDKLEAHLRALPVITRSDQVGATGAQLDTEATKREFDAEEADCERALGLRPGAIAEMGDFVAYHPETNSFRKEDGTMVRREEVTQ